MVIRDPLEFRVRKDRRASRVQLVRKAHRVLRGQPDRLGPAGFGVVITDPGNTAVGDEALGNNTGQWNTATGFQTLVGNTTGGDNTALGSYALHSNTTGGYNTATGVLALSNNTTGNDNTANGLGTLLGNTTGSENTALGFSALFFQYHRFL